MISWRVRQTHKTTRAGGMCCRHLLCMYMCASRMRQRVGSFIFGERAHWTWSVIRKAMNIHNARRHRAYRAAHRIWLVCCNNNHNNNQTHFNYETRTNESVARLLNKKSYVHSNQRQILQIILDTKSPLSVSCIIVCKSLSISFLPFLLLITYTECNTWVKSPETHHHHHHYYKQQQQQNVCSDAAADAVVDHRCRRRRRRICERVSFIAHNSTWQFGGIETARTTEAVRGNGNCSHRIAGIGKSAQPLRPLRAHARAQKTCVYSYKRYTYWIDQQVWNTSEWIGF